MIYQFDDFELDSINFCLKKDGKDIEIEPQVFDLITYLVKNHNRLVTRDEIFETLWANRNVLDATLSNHIKNARSVLGDDGQSQKVIKTVHGRGYQFIAEIKTDGPQHDSNNTDKIPAKTFKRKILVPFFFSSFLLLLIFLFSKAFNTTSAVPEKLKSNLSQKSIAILPFENRSDLKKDEYFTDGIHDDLLTLVSKIDKLKTISRTSMMSYRNTTKNMRVIGEELGVTAILEGGVQRAGNEIRINVQLINTLTDEHMWAESYTKKLTPENIFSIQTEITQAIAKRLEIIFSPQTKAVPTQNLAALESFFQAKFNINKNTNEGFHEAIKYLKKTIELDDSFALAYVELASRYLDQIYYEGLHVEKQIAKAKPLLNKALELDGSMSHAYRVLAKLKMHSQDFDAGKLAYERAIELNPNNADALGAYGNYQFVVGNVPRAVAYLTKAIELNPKNEQLAIRLADNLLRIGNFEDVKEIADKIIKNNPNSAEAYRLLSDLKLYSEHQFAESMQLLQKSINLQPSSPSNPMIMGIRYLHVGDNERAIEWLSYIMKLSPESSEAKVTKADIYSLNGKFDEAFEIYIREAYLNPKYTSHLISAGIDAERYEEAIEHSKKIVPNMFKHEPIVNNTNFHIAIAIGKWFKKHEKYQQANWLFQQSLQVVQQSTVNNSFNGKQGDWITVIYLAMDKKKEALASFSQLLGEGFYSNYYIIGANYEPLQNEPEYQRLVKIIKSKLDIDKKKLHQMEASGELKVPVFPTNSI